MHVLTMGPIQSASKEHSVSFTRLPSRPAKTLFKTLLSLFHDGATIVCGVLVCCCHICPLNNTEALGLGFFLDSSHEQSKLSKVPTAARRCSLTFQMVSVCESLCLCMLLVSGVAWSSLGLCSLFSIFAHTHVSV